MFAGGGGGGGGDVIVRSNWFDNPPAVAVTVNVPGLPLAVSVGAVAIFLLFGSVMLFPDANVPLEPPVTVAARKRIVCIAGMATFTV